MLPPLRLPALVLSDFDGTLTRSDTFRAFLFFFFGQHAPRFRALKAFWHFALWKGRFTGADEAKEAIWGALFAGYDEARLWEAGAAFSKQVLPRLFRRGAVEALIEYRRQGAQVVIVTASPAYWIAPWCRAHGFDLIATGYACEQGKITGKYAGKNCRGAEKAVRIEAAYPLAKYPTIVAFGDTPDDQPMLLLATHPYYRHFEQL